MKTALVTGASRGIGRAIALELKSKDFSIIGTATSKAGVDALIENGIEGYILDLNSPNSIVDFWEQLEADKKNISVLVNNAGITRDNIVLRMSDDEWSDIMNVHLNGTFQLCKRSLKMMLKNKWGRIINISSASASIGNRGQSNYAAAKAGVEAFTKSLAKEVGKRDITINAVAPGFIATDMTDALDDKQKEAINGKIPAGKMGSVDDIAAAVCYLASDESGYVTGQTLHINGGMLMV